jgi:RNA polymerase sigma-70 factor (ECF subfamily)
MMTTTTYETANVEEAELLACVPHLRAFALFLSKNRSRADDLVQDTIVRALTAAHQFRVGTNLKAWLFTILRHQHYNTVRKYRLQMESLDDPHAFEPSVPASQMVSLEFADFRRAFWQLNDSRREALILVGANGLSYAEAAKVCNCPMGTIKSRVSRAREELLKIMEDGFPGNKRRDLPAMAGYIGNPLANRATMSLAASA